MSADPAREIAEAVLYEGYVLWPYRRSATKNRQRFTFGGVYPRGWPDDRSELVTECLLQARGDPGLEATVRFLHVVERRVHDESGRPVDELTVAGERHLSWEEATEREVTVALGDAPKGGATVRVPLEIRAGIEEEPLAGGGPSGSAAGPGEVPRGQRTQGRGPVVVRSWEALRGAVELSAEPQRPGLVRVRVRVENLVAWDGGPRERTLRRTLCSTHVVMRAREGAFVSLTDPPGELRTEAAACRNEGAWPVLVGEEGERHTVLAAPIILEDHPRVAPESPGNLFDGAEIDGLLTLNILALTDEEKAEMRASDPRSREILERTESLSADDLMRLHGTMRDPRELR